MTKTHVQFLEHLGCDPLLQVKVEAAVTADEVALLAQELGYGASREAIC